MTTERTYVPKAHRCGKANEPDKKSQAPTDGNPDVAEQLASPRLNLLLWRQDPSLRYQWWLVALASFVIFLVLIASSAVSTQLNNARNQVAAELTVQVPTLDAGFQLNGEGRSLKQVTDLLGKTAGIETVRALSVQEIREILRPWVGDDVELQGLPVPYVLAVTRSSEGDDLNLRDLKAQLDQIDPGIVLDDHSQTLKDLGRLDTVAQVLVGFALLFAIIILAAVTGIAVNIALRMQRQVLDVLFQAGASDGFIARQFMLFTLGFTLRGLVIGGGAAIASYLLALPLLDLSVLRGPFFGFSLGQVLSVTSLCLVTLASSVLTCRLLVMQRLKQLY